MTINSLTQVILNLWEKDKLAPLYLIRPPLLEPHRSLQEWSHELECKILMGHYGIDHQRAEEKRQGGHPDLLNIYKEESDKFYKVDNPGIIELFKMQAHKSIELNRRFVFIHEGELIKETLANKLLKVLEDPSKDTTIFILNNSQKEMLQTIESRAVKLSLFPSNDFEYKNESFSDLKKRLSANLSQQHGPFIDDVFKGSLSDAIDYLQKNEQCAELFLNCMADHAKDPNSSLKFKNAYLQCLSEEQKLSTFYVSHSTRQYMWLNLTQLDN